VDIEGSDDGFWGYDRYMEGCYSSRIVLTWLLERDSYRPESTSWLPWVKPFLT
jgi:hypothetical protein